MTWYIIIMYMYNVLSSLLCNNHNHLDTTGILKFSLVCSSYIDIISSTVRNVYHIRLHLHPVTYVPEPQRIQCQ